MRSWQQQNRVCTFIQTWLAPMLPVLAALLFAAFDRLQTADGASWAQFLGGLAAISVAGLPLATAHLFALRSPGGTALALWLAAFVIYPLAALGLADAQFPLALRHALIAALFSAAALLSRGGRGRIVTLVDHLPLTLDGVAVSLLTIWVLGVTSLFGSTPDAVNNQPLKVWFDGARLIRHPLVFASYFVQFSIAAALLFGFYWVCRHVLIRRVLRQDGWIAMAQASLAFWIVFTPLAGSIVLLLPLNPPDWSLLPSENHNPFDPQNYGFTAIAWTVIMPVVLAAERLLADRREAEGSRERVRAELHMLHQQINPHFLFNSLNTVYALGLTDNKASSEAVAKLSDLLRYTVYRGQTEWVALADEIACLANYIDLQLLRFGPRCRVSSSFPDTTDHLTIPPMLLIMLVENAFKHGVEPLDEAVDIRIELTVKGSEMLFVCINRPLPDMPNAHSGGLGLANLRRRLELIYDGQFELSSEPGNGVWVARLACGLRPC